MSGNTEAERMAMSDSEYDLAQENERLRERLLERNNVHRRLVKLREALEQIAHPLHHLTPGGDDTFHGWDEWAEAARAIARQALEGEETDAQA